MVKQSSIHLKLDTDILDRLDRVCYFAGINRNKAINIMVKVLVSRCEFELITSNYKSVHFFRSYSYLSK